MLELFKINLFFGERDLLGRDCWDCVLLYNRTIKDQMRICDTQLVDQVVKSLDDNTGSNLLYSWYPSCSRGTSTAGSGDTRAGSSSTSGTSNNEDGEDMVGDGKGLLGDGVLGMERGERGSWTCIFPNLDSRSLFCWSREEFSNWRFKLEFCNREFSSWSFLFSSFIFASSSSSSSIYAFFLSLKIINLSNMVFLNKNVRI